MKITKIVAAVVVLATALVALDACQCHKQAPAPATTGRSK
jgi:hypothetical protein